MLFKEIAELNSELDKWSADFHREAFAKLGVEFPISEIAVKKYIDDNDAMFKRSNNGLTPGTFVDCSVTTTPEEKAEKTETPPRKPWDLGSCTVGLIMRVSDTKYSAGRNCLFLTGRTLQGATRLEIKNSTTDFSVLDSVFIGGCLFAHFEFLVQNFIFMSCSLRLGHPYIRNICYRKLHLRVCHAIIFLSIIIFLGG